MSADCCFSNSVFSDFSNFSGYIWEPPCPSLDNDGQWASLVKTGDVKAMFFGHDHTNSYMTTVDGVDAYNVPGASYHASSSFIEQGAMIVTLDETNTDTYSTDMVYANDLAVKDNSSLPNSERSKLSYGFSIVCRIALKYIVGLLRYIIPAKY